MQTAKMWFDDRGGWRLAAVDSTGRKWIRVLTLETQSVRITKVPMDTTFRETDIPVETFIRRALGENVLGEERNVSVAAIESFENIIQGMADGNS